MELDGFHVQEKPSTLNKNSNDDHSWIWKYIVLDVIGVFCLLMNWPCLKPGAHPTNGIPMEFKIWSKFGVL